MPCDYHATMPCGFKLTWRGASFCGAHPVEHWHEYLADPTLADAILDRIVHQSHKLKLKGESLRKKETV